MSIDAFALLTFWETVSLSAIAQAYGDEEPDYELAEVKEPNPEYKPEL